MARKPKLKIDDRVEFLFLGQTLKGTIIEEDKKSKTWKVKCDSGTIYPFLGKEGLCTLLRKL